MESLLGILFALIVLVPILLLVGNFSRLSDQAQENFGEFTIALNSMSHSTNMDDRKSHLLIMDDETMIALFNNRVTSVQVDTKALTLTDYTIDVQRPGACTTTRCLCLIQNADVETVITSNKVIVSPTKSYCEDLDYDLAYIAGSGGCGVGESSGEASYKCRDGWFIDRGMIKAEWFVSAYFSVQRRTYLVIGPKEGGVKIGLSRKVVS